MNPRIRSSGRGLAVRWFVWCLLVGFLGVAPAANAHAQEDAVPDEATAAAAETPDDSAVLVPGGTKRSTIPTSPLEVAQAMGWLFVVPFVLASIVAVWFAIERLVVLRRGRVIPRPFVDRFLHHLEEGKLDPDSALQLCQENGSPVAQVFAHGIRKWGKPSVEVEQAIIDGGERQVSQLRSHLRVLNSVATITPLIGLLGTVIGMIQGFNQIALSVGTERTETLAVGIALALLTTAAGLLIAIPALSMYMYLAGKVDSLVVEMDLLAQNVVHLISAEALMKDPAAAPRASGSSRRVATGTIPPPEPKQKRAV